jgi:hypothetical protein
LTKAPRPRKNLAAEPDNHNAQPPGNVGEAGFKLDTSKLIATSRQISYLIVALGVIAFYLAWIKSEDRSQWWLHVYLQKVITVSELLSGGGWASGQELTPFGLLVEFDPLIGAEVSTLQMECAKEPAPGDCQNWRNWRQAFLAKYPSVTSPDKIPNARFFTRNFRGDNEPGCSFVIFRGTNDQVYHIPAFMKLGVDQPIPGDQIYTVFFNGFCQSLPALQYVAPFVIIDTTSLGGGWYCGIPDWAKRSVLGDVSFSLVQGLPITNNDRFDMRSFLTDFQRAFLSRQISEVPNVMYIEHMEGLYTGIIRDAARKSGTLFDRADFEKAAAQLFVEEAPKPNFLGITLDANIAANISPVVMFWLSVLLWHSVRRIDFTKSPFEEPWLLVDIKGRIEAVLACCWIVVMLFAQLSIFWVVLVYNNARFPQLHDWQSFWQDRINLARQLNNLQFLGIDWSATAFALVLLGGSLPLVAALFILLKGQWIVYRGRRAKQSWLASVE